LRYRDHVATLLELAANAPKSDRTRLRLKLSAIDLLEQIGYLDVRVQDIALNAETAVGTFYTYFTDKKAITVELMVELVAFLDDQNRLAIGGTDQFATILTKNTQYVRVYSANAGLLRCLHQLCDADSDFQEVWNDTNYRFSKIFADGMKRRQTKRVGQELLQLVGYALSSMIDELLRLIYVVKDPRLVSLAATDEHVAEVLAILWYRAVYASDPPGGRLNLAAELLGAANTAIEAEATPLRAKHARRSGGDAK
jgi:AcrR family transcriptional regulator